MQDKQQRRFTPLQMPTKKLLIIALQFFAMIPEGVVGKDHTGLVLKDNPTIRRAAVPRDAYSLAEMHPNTIGFCLKAFSAFSDQAKGQADTNGG